MSRFSPSLRRRRGLLPASAVSLFPLSFFLLPFSFLLFPFRLPAADEPNIGTGPLGVRGYRNDWTSRYPDANPVTAWDLEKGINVIWRRPTVRYGNSGPLIAGDRLIFVIEPARVVCVNKLDGNVFWTSPVSSLADYEGLFTADLNSPWSRRELKYGEHGGLTYATPVTDGKRLWFKLANTAVCLDLATGARLWSTPLRFAPGDHPHCVPSPLLFGRVLLCQGGMSEYWQYLSQNHLPDGAVPPNANKGKFHQWLVALEAETGKILWDVGPLNGSEYGLAGTPAPLVLDDGQHQRRLVVTHEGHVFDLETGKLVIPSVGARAGSAGGTPLGDRMLFKSAIIQFGFGEDGNPVVKNKLWLESEGGVYSNHRIYGCGRSKDGGSRFLHVLDADTGKRLYPEQRIGPVGALKPKDLKVDGSWDYPRPALAGRFVYVSSTHVVGVADVSEGRPCPVAVNRVERMHVAPVFDGDRTYLRTYDALYCVARKGAEGLRYEQEVNARTLLNALTEPDPPAVASKNPKDPPPKPRDPSAVEAERKALVKEWSGRLRRVVETLPGTPEAAQAEALLKVAE